MRGREGGGREEQLEGRGWGHGCTLCPASSQTVLFLLPTPPQNSFDEFRQEPWTERLERAVMVAPVSCSVVAPLRGAKQVVCRRTHSSAVCCNVHAGRPGCSDGLVTAGDHQFKQMCLLLLPQPAVKKVFNWILGREAFVEPRELRQAAEDITLMVHQAGVVI